MAVRGKRVWHALLIAAALVAAIVAVPRPTFASGPLAGQRLSGRDARPRVVFVNPGMTGEVIWTMVSATMRAAAEQLDMDLSILVAERDRVRMKQLALQTIEAESPPDALVLVNEEQAATDLMRAADARGIKVVMLLSDITGEDRQEIGGPGERHANWIASIVPDDRGAGQRMAATLAAFAERRQARRDGTSAPEPRRILALHGDTITPASMARDSGLHDVLNQPDSGLALERVLVADWNADKARDLLNRALNHNARQGEGPPVGIWAANDALALGAIRALRDNGLEPGRDVGVVGLDWSPPALEEISRGALLTSEGGHFFAGAWAMVVLRDNFDGLDIAAHGPTIVFPMAPVDAGNIDAFRATIGGIIMRAAFGEIDFARFRLSGEDTAAGYDFSLPALVAALGPPATRVQGNCAQPGAERADHPGLRLRRTAQTRQRGALQNVLRK